MKNKKKTIKFLIWHRIGVNSALFSISDVDAKMAGMELIVHDEQPIVCNRRMSCADMEPVCIPMMRTDFDAFVIKAGLVMVQHQLVIKM